MTPMMAIMGDQVRNERDQSFFEALHFSAFFPIAVNKLSNGITAAFKPIPQEFSAVGSFLVKSLMFQVNIFCGNLKPAEANIVNMQKLLVHRSASALAESFLHGVVINVVDKQQIHFVVNLPGIDELLFHGNRFLDAHYIVISNMASRD